MLRALRGATTIDADTPEQVHDRVVALLREIFERNDVDQEQLVSMVFTATGDIRSVFPATAARSLDLDDVPMLCARELDIEGATPRCIRVLMHLHTEVDRHQLRHVYLEGASTLRDDLPA